MTRLKKEDVKQIKQILADLIFNHKDDIEFIDGKPSSSFISKYIKDNYGILVTRQAVARYIEEGLDEYRKTIIISDNEKIRDIKEAMGVQKSIWNDRNNSPNDRTKASNAWKALQKQLIDYEKMLNDAAIKQAEVLRPVYLIQIKPKSVLVKCPKCKHEWYDIKDEKVSSKKKVSPNGESEKITFETNKNQKSFDDFKKDEDNE